MRHLKVLKDRMRFALSRGAKAEPDLRDDKFSQCGNGGGRIVLCLGTQKAGTSWLFDFLKGVGSVEMGFLKEMHVFDRLEFPSFMHEDLGAVEAVHSREQILLNRDLWARLSFISDPEKYFDYFCGILRRKGVSISGDFTPEYCILPEERLEFLKNGFLRRGVDVKVVFLMRDPVERIWSAQRMTARVHGKQFTLLESYRAEYIEMLTRYEVIVPKIQKVFGGSNVYINFYENLFTEGTISEILKFLELPQLRPDFGRRVNASRYQEILPEDRKIVADYYSETYDFVREEFKDLYPVEAWSM